MNYTKEQIKSMIKQMLEDIKRPYFEHMPFDIKFKNNIYIFETKNTIVNGWDILVYVQEDQFPDKDEYSIIHIVVNDETGDIEIYSDNSCGRPVPLKAKLENDKYEFKAI